jgi:uncharacterized membrane protein YGL010W
MRSFQNWMDEYAQSHQHPTNQIIHKICVPLIMFSVIGLIWMIPTPSSFNQIPFLNWATLFVLGCMLFYTSLNLIMSAGMLILTTLMILICQKLYEGDILLQVSILIFIISWIFQFYGHKLEGKKPSFLKDLAFLLIGPLWVLRFFYKKIGLNI